MIRKIRNSIIKPSIEPVILVDDPWTPEQGNVFSWHDCSDRDTVRESAGRCDVVFDKADDHNILQIDFALRPLTDFFINGLHALSFNGVNTYLEDDLSSTMDNVTIIMVYDQNTTADMREGGLRGLGIQDTVAPSSDNTVRYDGAFQAATIAPTIGPHIRVTTKTLTRQQDYIDGVVNFDVETVKPPSNLRINMGLCQALLSPINAFDGLVGEMIILDYEISTIERHLYESYLSNKWGLPIN